MPTFWSKSLIPTARNVPAEAVVPSHQLMLRAGLIRQLGAGAYEYLPLGYRALRKAMDIVREEMDAAGAVEVFLPTLHPIELWELTGRRAAYGDNLFVVKDRHGRESALGPTHEEVFTEMTKAFVESYRQLPITLYQIQTKFRDEYRPRFGVLRSREFQMKDAYSFDTTREGLDKSYDAMYNAYIKIFQRCGIPIRIVEAESGPIGGSASHEFMVPSPTGEDVILESDKGNYAANMEKCEIGTRDENIEGEPTGELEKVHTPNCPGIVEVGKLMKTKTKNMLKTLVFKVNGIKPPEQRVMSGVPADAKWLLCVVRGDHEVNEGKLRRRCDMEIELADEREARDAGFAIGYVGPHAAVGREDTVVFADHDVMQGGFWVTGANEADHHVKHFNWNRDYLMPRITAMKPLEPVRDIDGSTYTPPSPSILDTADLRNAVEGDPSPKNDGGILRSTKGIEIGHVFKLGTKYTQAMDFTVVDETNNRIPVLMGCYGIGVNRILASAIERKDAQHNGHDENGIIWPAAIAPFQVCITPIKYEGALKETADKLAAEIESLRSPVGPCTFFHPDVIIDDREERPGVKFKDADLVGFPVRITIGDKALAEGKVEIKARTAAKAELIPVAEAAAKVIELLAGM